MYIHRSDSIKINNSTKLHVTFTLGQSGLRPLGRLQLIYTYKYTCIFAKYLKIDRYTSIQATPIATPAMVLLHFWNRSLATEAQPCL